MIFAEHTAFMFRVGNFYPEDGDSMLLRNVITTYKTIVVTAQKTTACSP
jgi:hypothetical protein